MESLTRSTSWLLRAVVLLSAYLLAFAAAAQPIVRFDTVGLSDDLGGPEILTRPQLNRRGDVLIASQRALYLRPAGASLRRLARQSFSRDPEPGDFSALRAVRLSDEGRVFGRFDSTGFTGSQPTGIYATGASGALDLLVGVGEPVVGSDATIDFLLGANDLEAGVLDLAASIRAPSLFPHRFGRDYGTAGALLTRDPAGALRLVTREGLAAPGTDGSFSRLGASSAIGEGRLLLHANVDRGIFPGATPGFWLYDRAGNGSLVALAGDAAPGATGMFLRPIVQSDGAEGFTLVSDLLGSGDPARDAGIWQDRGSGFALRVLEGDPAPGTGGVFGEFPGNPFESAALAGRLAFKAALVRGVGGVTDADDEGLWAQDPDGEGFSLVLRKGQDVDGLAPGDVVGAVGAWDFTDDGRIIAQADVSSGTDASVDTGDALLRIDPDTGFVSVLLATGDTIEVATGDVRTLAAIDVSALGFTSSRIAFRADFEDRSSGIIVAIVPEPGTASLLCVGLVLLARCRRRGFAARSAIR